MPVEKQYYYTCITNALYIYTSKRKLILHWVFISNQEAPPSNRPHVFWQFLFSVFHTCLYITRSQHTGLSLWTVNTHTLTHTHTNTPSHTQMQVVYVWIHNSTPTFCRSRERQQNKAQCVYSCVGKWQQFRENIDTHTPEHTHTHRRKRCSTLFLKSWTMIKLKFFHVLNPLIRYFLKLVHI